MRRLKSCLTRENGQSMVEYGIMIAFVALACLGAFQALGQLALALNLENAAIAL